MTLKTYIKFSLCSCGDWAARGYRDPFIAVLCPPFPICQSWYSIHFYQEHMSRQRRRRSVQLPCMPRCHRNTNSGRKLSIFGNCASIGNALGHRHTRIATPTSARGFVFRWHPSYTLLHRLRRLICSYFYIIDLFGTYMYMYMLCTCIY
jgi:hypothetical protein